MLSSSPVPLTSPAPQQCLPLAHTPPEAPPYTQALPLCLMRADSVTWGLPRQSLTWPGPQFACTVIAILLHFLFLCTFSWALLEALHLYRALTEVRDVNAGPMRFYYMLGWGVPAFITGTPPLSWASRFCMPRSTSVPHSPHACPRLHIPMPQAKFSICVPLI